MIVYIIIQLLKKLQHIWIFPRAAFRDMFNHSPCRSCRPNFPHRFQQPITPYSSYAFFTSRNQQYVVSPALFMPSIIMPNVYTWSTHVQFGLSTSFSWRMFLPFSNVISISSFKLLHYDLTTVRNSVIPRQFLRPATSTFFDEFSTAPSLLFIAAY